MSAVQDFWKQPSVQIPSGGLVSAPLLGALSEADRPPVVQPLVVSDWQDKVGNAIGSIPQQAMQDKQGFLNLQQQGAQTQTALTEQAMAQARLKSLQNPIDSNGNPIVDSSGRPVDQSKYLMTIGPDGITSIGPNPITLAAQGQIFGNGPYIPNSNTPAQPQASTQRQTVPSAPNAPVPSQPVYNAPVLQPLNIGSGSSNTANPQTFNLQSGSASAGQAAPIVAGSMLSGAMPSDTSSPNPLDDPNNLANRSHITPEEAMAWGKQNWRTDIVSARQEFDGQGNATNRNILTLKDGANQPVHSAYVLANPGAGGWQSDLTTSPNPALASNPTALTAAASAPVASAIQNSGPNAPSNVSPLLAQAMQPAQGTLAQKLQAGSITPQDVLSVGGSPWAGTNNAPSAPMPTPYQNASWLNKTPTGQPTPLPSAPTSVVPRAQPVRPTPLPPPEYPDDPTKKTFGLSAQEVLAQAQNCVQRQL